MWAMSLLKTDRKALARVWSLVTWSRCVPCISLTSLVRFWEVRFSGWCWWWSGKAHRLWTIKCFDTAGTRTQSLSRTYDAICRDEGNVSRPVTYIEIVFFFFGTQEGEMYSTLKRSSRWPWSELSAWSGWRLDTMIVCCEGSKAKSRISELLLWCADVWERTRPWQVIQFSSVVYACYSYHWRWLICSNCTIYSSLFLSFWKITDITA